MKEITLTRNDGISLSLNTNHIVLIEEHNPLYNDTCKSAITIATGRIVYVRETRIEILEKNKIRLNG
jgi:uncharacterized protein YlzI (FlbEa/FlbD family)